MQPTRLNTLKLVNTTKLKETKNNAREPEGQSNRDGILLVTFLLLLKEKPSS